MTTYCQESSTVPRRPWQRRPFAPTPLASRAGLDRFAPPANDDVRRWSHPLFTEIVMSLRVSSLLTMAVVAGLHTAPLQAQTAKLTWGPGPASLPPGARKAVVSGDPTKPGPFKIRLDLPDRFTVAPHF